MDYRSYLRSAIALTALLGVILACETRLDDRTSEPHEIYAPSDEIERHRRGSVGIVVERAEPDGTFEVGDVLLEWQRTKRGIVVANGNLPTPFAFSRICTEQVPFGNVEVLAARGGYTRWRQLSACDGWAEVVPRLGGSDLRELRSLVANVGKSSRSDTVSSLRRLATRAGKEMQSWLFSWSILDIGRKAARQGRYDDARFFFHEALCDAKRHGDENRTASVSLIHGIELSRLKDYEQAETSLLAALQIEEKRQPGSLTVARARFHIGSLYLAKGDLELAESHLRGALTLRERQVPGSLEFAESMTGLASLIYRQGDLDTAEEFLTAALDALRQCSPVSLTMAKCLGLLGLVELERGVDYDSAERLLRKALALQQRLDPTGPDRARTINNLGTVEYRRGRLTEAEAYYERSLQLEQAISSDHPGVASALGNLALVAYDRDEIDVAAQRYEAALELGRKVAPDSLLVSTHLIGLGNVAYVRGDLRGAERYYRQALGTRSRLAPDSLGVALVLQNLGIVAQRRGQLAIAEELVSEAQTLRERHAPGSTSVASSSMVLGVISDLAGRTEDADAYYRRSYRIRGELAPESLDVAATLVNMGMLAEKRGDLEDAERRYRRALRIKRHHAPNSLTVAGALGHLADVRHKQCDREETMALLFQALDIRDRAAPSSLENALILESIGTIAAKRGDTDAAERYLRRAVTAIEELVGRLGGSHRAQSIFYSRNSSPFRRLVALLIEQGRLEDAFEVTERSRALVLRMSMLASGPDHLRQLCPDQLQELERMAAEYDLLSRELGMIDTVHGQTQIMSTRVRMQQILEERAAILSECVPQQEQDNPPHIFNALLLEEAMSADTAMISYWVSEESTTIFAQDKDRRLHVKTTPFGRRQLEQRVQTFRSLILNVREGSRRYEQMLMSATDLYEVLLAPVENHISTAGRLLLIPDSPLYQLPFAALVVRGRTSKETRSWQYLVEWKPLHYAPSGTVYGWLHSRDERSRLDKDLVVFAYQTNSPNSSQLTADRILPDLDGFLTGIDFEVAGLRRLFPERSLIFVGDEATESRFKSLRMDVSYLHLACHSLLDTAAPMNSALVLAGDGSDNGYLQAWEIMEQPGLRANLIVLSGCETGQGEEISSEGLLGLTRAFQSRAAPSIISSQWKVPDDATALLMVRLYEKLASGSPKDEALRSAQLAVLSNRTDSCGDGLPDPPYFWAAFQLNGRVD